MEWPITRAANPDEEIAAATYPNLRLFMVARAVGQQPLPDCKGSWAACSPETVPGFSAVGYFFGRELHQELDVPIGLIKTAWGGTVAEAWTSDEGLAGESDFEPILERAKKWQPGKPNQASALYNGMLHPIIPFAMRGAIWYQGESNVKRAVQYTKLFPAMIADWRKQWGQGDFPFIFVQLAPYGYSDGRQVAELWDAQLKTLRSVRNTGMAVITDIGNNTDIHPKNKQDVGLRLALWALADTYEKDVVKSGPLYRRKESDGSTIRIEFDFADGLKSRDGKPLTDFTIAGEDGEFVPATAEIDGDTVVVTSDAVKQPVAVRFGWGNTVNPNLVNGAGLPASPLGERQICR
jgi:sialate O-acetylesterase